MLTKKDYIAIAAIFKAAREGRRHMAHLQTLDLLVEDFADMLARDNPRFDRIRFFAATGRPNGQA